MLKQGLTVWHHKFINSRSRHFTILRGFISQTCKVYRSLAPSKAFSRYLLARRDRKPEEKAKSGDNWWHFWKAYILCLTASQCKETTVLIRISETSFGEGIINSSAD